MRTALLQLTSSDVPADNLLMVQGMIAEAVANGAGFILTPEVTNCLSSSRTHQTATLQLEDDDIVLLGLRECAAKYGVWLSVGSLALKTTDSDGRFANRQFLIAPTGQIVARYDKIHMFDVQVSKQETYRESAGYRPGSEAVIAETPFATIGLSICYDIRFPALYRRLAQAGAEVLTIPAAFSKVTGMAHWKPLLQARAIETGCWVLASAQTGLHPATRGRQRESFGHAMAINPWGEIVAEAGLTPEVLYVELEREHVVQARRRVPSLTHDRDFNGPDPK